MARPLQPLERLVALKTNREEDARRHLARAQADLHRAKAGRVAAEASLAAIEVREAARERSLYDQLLGRRLDPGEFDEMHDVLTDIDGARMRGEAAVRARKDEEQAARTVVDGAKTIWQRRRKQRDTWQEVFSREDRKERRRAAARIEDEVDDLGQLTTAARRDGW
jgi:flagellar biosynthesis chaperone FliJ